MWLPVAKDGQWDDRYDFFWVPALPDSTDPSVERALPLPDSHALTPARRAHAAHAAQATRQHHHQSVRPLK
jgi:hypothetical protein